MYLTFNKTNKIVSRICEEEIVSYTEGFELARYYGEIPKNDYLTVTNLSQKTGTKLVEKLDENGLPIINKNGETVTEEKTITYLTCDLVANFYPPKTEEELAKEKDEQYGKLVETLIRKKYSSRDVEAIHSNYLEALNPDSDISEEKRKEYIAEFKAFQEYRLECKEIARAEIYK